MPILSNVLDLKRVSYGPFTLNNLPTGKTRYLTAKEYELLHKFIKEEEKRANPVKLKTRYKTQMIDITEEVAEEVVRLGVTNGLCTVFSTHTTASIVFFENQDPTLQRDFLAALSRVAPNDFNYISKDTNVPAHIKSTLCGSKSSSSCRKWSTIFRKMASYLLL